MLSANFAEMDISDMLNKFCDITQYITGSESRINADDLSNTMNKLYEGIDHIRVNRLDDCITFERFKDNYMNSNKVHFLIENWIKMTRMGLCSQSSRTIKNKQKLLIDSVGIVDRRFYSLCSAMLPDQSTMKCSCVQPVNPCGQDAHLQQFSSESLANTYDLNQLKSMTEICPICRETKPNVFAIFENCRHTTCLSCAEWMINSQVLVNMKERKDLFNNVK